MPTSASPPSRRGLLRDKLKQLDEQETKLRQLASQAGQHSQEARAQYQEITETIAARRQALQKELQAREEIYQQSVRKLEALRDADLKKVAAEQAKAAHDRLKNELARRYPPPASAMNPRDLEQYLASRDRRDTAIAAAEAARNMAEAQSARLENLQREFPKSLDRIGEELFQQTALADPCVPCAIAKLKEQLSAKAIQPTAFQKKKAEAIELIRKSDFAQTVEGKKVLKKIEALDADSKIVAEELPARVRGRWSKGEIKVAKKFENDVDAIASELVHEATHAVHKDEFPASRLKKTIDEEMRTNINQLDLYEEQRESGFRDPGLEIRRTARVAGKLRDNVKARYPNSAESL